MTVSDPGSGDPAQATTPNGCTAVGTTEYPMDAVARVAVPTSAATAWTNAPLRWSSCRSRARHTVLTIPCHFTASTITVSIMRRILTNTRNAAIDPNFIPTGPVVLSRSRVQVFGLARMHYTMHTMEIRSLVINAYWIFKGARLLEFDDECMENWTERSLERVHTWEKN